MNKLGLSLICATSVLFSSGSFASGQVQGNLGVKLTIDNGCQVTGGTSSDTGNNFGTLDFGTYGGTITNTIRAQSTTSSSALQVNCTNALPYTVSVDNGANALLVQRRMNDGTGKYINYNLYQDSTYIVPWLSATPKAALGTGTATNLVFYGAVPGGQSATAGNYTDTVVVTVAW